MFLLLLGVTIFLLVRNDFDLQRMGKDIRRILRAGRRIIRDISRSIRNKARENQKETAETRTAERGQDSTAQTAPAVRKERPETEAQDHGEMMKDPDHNTLMAAMLANVPTLNFPKDDPKYDSSRKYTYA